MLISTASRSDTLQVPVLRRKAAQGEICRMNAPLRDYQQALVKAAGTKGNHIIVLPTGTGKTRIVVELARQLSLSKPGSRTIFLTATVTLAQQQAGTRFKSCVDNLKTVLISHKRLLVHQMY